MKVNKLQLHSSMGRLVVCLICSTATFFTRPFRNNPSKTAIYLYLSTLDSSNTALCFLIRSYLLTFALFFFIELTDIYYIGIYYLCITQVFVYCLSPQLECKLHINNDFVLFSTEYSVLSRAWHLISAQ